MELILIQTELPLGGHCKIKAFFKFHCRALAIFSNECLEKKKKIVQFNSLLINIYLCTLYFRLQEFLSDQYPTWSVFIHATTTSYRNGTFYKIMTL